MNLNLNMYEIADAINRGNFTTEQLKVISWSMRAAQRRAADHARYARHVGERVQFEARGRTYKGEVEKINIKNIKVITDDGRRWNVSPVLLSPIA